MTLARHALRAALTAMAVATSWPGLAAPPDEAVAALVGGEWRWTATLVPGRMPVVANRPGLYAIVFQADGVARLALHCNSGGALWRTDGPGRIAFVRTASTQLACLERGATDYYFEGDLRRAQSYRVDGDELRLEISDGGTMLFYRVRR